MNKLRDDKKVYKPYVEEENEFSDTNIASQETWKNVTIEKDKKIASDQDLNTDRSFETTTWVNPLSLDGD